MLSTRPAAQSDTDFLRGLHHAAYRDVVLRQFGAWDETAQDHWFEQGFTEAEYWIIEEDGQPVGAVATSEAEEHLSLVELQVHPERQNRGIGSAVLHAQIQRASLMHKRELRLRVLRANRALSLYQRHGFVVTGETDTHY